MLNEDWKRLYRNIYDSKLPSSTMVPIDASIACHPRMEPAPLRQIMELRKRAKLVFVLMYLITAEYESAFLSINLEANLCMIFEAEGPFPSIHEKINGQKVVFWTLTILCSYFSFLMDTWYFWESGMLLGQLFAYGLHIFTKTIFWNVNRRNHKRWHQI